MNMPVLVDTPITLGQAAANPGLAVQVAAEMIRFITRNREETQRKVIALDPGTRLERCLDPTHVHNSDSLRSNHPHGSTLVTNRWSGSFLELVGFSGCYFGFAAGQEPKHASSLAALQLGLFGVEAEMNHYMRRPGPNGAPSKLDAGVQQRGEKRLPNGEINLLLGLSGMFIVRYTIERPLRLLHVDFTSDYFVGLLQFIGSKPKVDMLLPENTSLETLFVSKDTRYLHLLYRAVATALHHQRHFLNIDGIVSTSLRAVVREGSRESKVVCIWGKDGEVLQQLRPVSVSYFNFDGIRPKEMYTRIEPGTDFAELRRKATQ